MKPQASHYEGTLPLGLEFWMALKLFSDWQVHARALRSLPANSTICMHFQNWVSISWGQMSVDANRTLTRWACTWICRPSTPPCTGPKRRILRGQSTSRNYKWIWSWPRATCRSSTRKSLSFDQHGNGKSKKEFRKNEKKSETCSFFS